MALTVLGLSGAVSHDPSAALYIDGKLVAAAEEERFVRDKHAKHRMPYEAAKFCLEFAGITAERRRRRRHSLRADQPRRQGALALRQTLLVRAGSRARRHPDRQPALLPLQEAHRMVPAAARLRPEEDRDRAGRAPSRARLQCLPLLRVPGENRHPRHRRQGRIRDDLLRLRRERPHPQDQGILRPGFARRPLRCDHRIPRLRDARRRIQGHGHGALRRSDALRFFAPGEIRERRTGHQHRLCQRDRACAATRKRARAITSRPS